MTIHDVIGEIFVKIKLLIKFNSKLFIVAWNIYIYVMVTKQRMSLPFVTCTENAISRQFIRLSFIFFFFFLLEKRRAVGERIAA